MPQKTVSGPLTRRRVPRRSLRAVTPEDPFGLASVSIKDMRAELERRTGQLNARGRAKQQVETPKLIAAIVRLARAAGKRVGPGMDIAALYSLAELRDEVERVIGDAARELTRKSSPDEPRRQRYSWTDVANALGVKDRQTVHDRYANPAGPRKRDGNPARPRRRS
jgi:hypothetical protein